MRCRVFVHNATHLHLVQWSSTLQEVVDSFWVVQHSHGPFPQGRGQQPLPATAGLHLEFA